MSRKEVLKKLRGICNSIAEDLDYELVDLEYVKENGRYFLRVYIHKDGGVDLEDCQKMSKNLSEKLDQEDPIRGTYYLEVSSPGLDRPLKSDKDLKRSIESDIEIKLYSPFDGKKDYEGKLIYFDSDSIKIEKDNQEIVEIPRESISMIRLSVKF